MTIFYLLKNLIEQSKSWAFNILKRSILQSKNPTCRFYPGSSVDNSSILGRYNVIFKDTVIINTVLGDHSIVQKNSRIMNADIGKFTSISSRVSIGLGRHPTEMVSTHAAFYSSSMPVAKTFCKTDLYEPFGRIVIGNDVTIFENVMIMDGVTIGDGAVIGMGSVVTGDIAAYSVVMGNPARHFMFRFSEEIRSKLLASKWWDLPDDWLQQNLRYFSDPDKFVGLSIFK